LFAGKEASTSVATKNEESAVTEERIAHILNEASAALRAQQVDESTSDESKPPSQTQVTITDREDADCARLVCGGAAARHGIGNH